MAAPAAAAASPISLGVAARGGLAAIHSELFAPERIVRTNIALPFLPGPPRIAFTLDNVFTGAECRELIRLTEAAGYGQALVNVGGGQQRLMTDVRNNTRCMLDDPVFAELFYNRIQAFLPPLVVDHHFSEGGAAQIVGLNERLRFLRYYKGEKFAHHYDGTFVRDAPEKGETAPEASFITVQLYLNSSDPVPNGPPSGDHSGGSTAFLDPSIRDFNRRADARAFEKAIDEGAVHCWPRAGRVLVFEHKLLHQGSEVSRGVKYTLRSDIMYQPLSISAVTALKRARRFHPVPIGPPEWRRPQVAPNGAGAAAAAEDFPVENRDDMKGLAPKQGGAMM